MKIVQRINTYEIKLLNRFFAENKPIRWLNTSVSPYLKNTNWYYCKCKDPLNAVGIELFDDDSDSMVRFFKIDRVCHNDKTFLNGCYVEVLHGKQAYFLRYKITPKVIDKYLKLLYNKS